MQVQLIFQEPLSTFWLKWPTQRGDGEQRTHIPHKKARQWAILCAKKFTWLLTKMKSLYKNKFSMKFSRVRAGGEEVFSASITDLESPLKKTKLSF